MLKKIILATAITMVSFGSYANTEKFTEIQDAFKNKKPQVALSLIREHKKDLELNKKKLTAQDYYWFGVLGIEEENIDVAIKNFKKSIEVDSTFAKSYMQLAQIYQFDLKFYNGAIEVIEDALKIKEIKSADKYEMLLRLASIHKEYEHYEKAGKILEQLYSFSPSEFRIVAPLLDVYAKTKSVKKLKEVSNEFYLTDTKSSFKISLLLMTLQEAEQYDEAKKYVDIMYDLWKNNEDDALKRNDDFVRDMYIHNDITYVVYEKFELKGDKAVKYVFVANHQGKRYSMGSYEYGNSFGRASGTLKEGERFYHFDLYERNEKTRSHSTIDMFPSKEVPSYYVAKKIIMDFVDDPVPMSSSEYRLKKEKK
jgi:tetratricopeptide (TPR) repeat protein